MGEADRRWLLRGVVLGLAILVGAVAWITSRDDDDQAPPTAPEARIVEESELGELAASTGYPVYWAGTIGGTSLELTESADGSVQVRYLEEEVEAGEGPAAALTVVSYPLADPAAALDAFAGEAGSIVRSGDGRRAVTSVDNPNSVYFVSPDNSVQVEVYDPSPKRALALVLSGQVRPAG